MKKAVLIVLIATLLFYLLVFVMPKEVKKPTEINMSFIEGNKISIELTDSYYYIQSCQLNYSENRDTVYLSVKRSTLANLFAKNKLGFRIIEIDNRVNVLSYCGTFIQRQHLQTVP